jgi:uncharacterized protein (DUF4415 family)
MSSNEPKMVRYHRKPLTNEQVERLKSVANVPDDKIDFSDIPDSTDEELRDAVRGLFYRPIKQQTTMRIDADVLDWFKQKVPDGKGYQTEINRVLREYVAKQAKRAG